MSKGFSRPRGTNDILPNEALLWQEIEQKARKVLNAYGYKEIRTPAFEESDLFIRSLGQTSDVVQKQMLGLEKEGLALRPEGTAPVVRAYLENSIDKKEGLAKLFYIGPMFRGERPQKGRLRQFHQIGVEAIGPNLSAPFLDAEVICLSTHILDILGIKGYTLKVNSLGTADDKTKLSKTLKENLKKELKNLCEDCQNRFERNVFRILDCKNEQCRKVVQKISVGDSYLSQESKEYFKTVLDALKNLGVEFKISPYLVRGLDYYTNTVFEISHESLGSQDALGAGGRYNTLLQDLGGSAELGGLGFALGLERLLLVKNEEAKKEPGLDVFVVHISEGSSGNSVYAKAFEYINLLRKNSIAADMVYMPMNAKPPAMKKQMSLASERAKFALIIGENELKENAVMLKDLKSATQEKVPAGQILEILKKKLC